MSGVRKKSYPAKRITKTLSRRELRRGKNSPALCEQYNKEDLLSMAYVLCGTSEAAAKMLGLSPQSARRVLTKQMKSTADYLDHPIKYMGDPITRREVLLTNLAFVTGRFLNHLKAPKVLEEASARESVDVVVKLLDKILVLLGKPSAIVAVEEVMPAEVVDKFLEELGYGSQRTDGHEDNRPQDVLELSQEEFSGRTLESQNGYTPQGSDKEIPSLPGAGDNGTDGKALPFNVAEVADGAALYNDSRSEGTREEYSPERDILVMENLVQSQHTHTPPLVVRNNGGEVDEIHKKGATE